MWKGNVINVHIMMLPQLGHLSPLLLPSHCISHFRRAFRLPLHLPAAAPPYYPFLQVTSFRSRRRCRRGRASATAPWGQVSPRPPAWPPPPPTADPRPPSRRLRWGKRLRRERRHRWGNVTPLVSRRLCSVSIKKCWHKNLRIRWTRNNLMKLFVLWGVLSNHH